jgi:hypothetical protein
VISSLEVWDLLLTVVVRLLMVWSDGGMLISMGKLKKLGEKLHSVSLCLPQIA